MESTDALSENGRRKVETFAKLGAVGAGSNASPHFRLGYAVVGIASEADRKRDFRQTVWAEPVEALLFFYADAKQGQGFDRLSPNGLV